MNRTDQAPTIDEFEAIFVNNSDFDRISDHLARFNPIRIMRADAKENRHSDILAWLLDPVETHGFGDRFLKTFLAKALTGGAERYRLSALEVMQADMRDAEIFREAHRIDILVLSERNGWGFIIENKFHSRQHQGQLEKYRTRLERMYSAEPKELAIQGVFLTLHDEKPHDESFAPIGYEAISKLLLGVIGRASQALLPEVETFLRHYIEILEDATGMNEDQQAMERIARSLYLKHKKSLDFIIEHGARTDFGIASHLVFGDEPIFLEVREIHAANNRRYAYVQLGKQFQGLLPGEWLEHLGGGKLKWLGCEKYWAELPLICWFTFSEDGDSGKGKLRLNAEVGPIFDAQFRAEVIDAIIQATENCREKVAFRKDATKEIRRFSRFLNNSTRKISNIQDADEIADDMVKLLKEFQEVFDAISAALPALTLRALNEGHAVSQSKAK